MSSDDFSKYLAQNPSPEEGAVILLNGQRYMVTPAAAEGIKNGDPQITQLEKLPPEDSSTETESKPEKDEPIQIQTEVTSKPGPKLPGPMIPPVLSSTYPDFPNLNDHRNTLSEFIEGLPGHYYRQPKPDIPRMPTITNPYMFKAMMLTLIIDVINYLKPGLLKFDSTADKGVRSLDGSKITPPDGKYGYPLLKYLDSFEETDSKTQLYQSIALTQQSTSSPTHHDAALTTRIIPAYMPKVLENYYNRSHNRAMSELIPSIDFVRYMNAIPNREQIYLIQNLSYERLARRLAPPDSSVFNAISELSLFHNAIVKPIVEETMSRMSFTSVSQQAKTTLLNTTFEIKINQFSAGNQIVTALMKVNPHLYPKYLMAMLMFPNRYQFLYKPEFSMTNAAAQLIDCLNIVMTTPACFWSIESQIYIKGLIMWYLIYFLRKANIARFTNVALPTLMLMESTLLPQMEVFVNKMADQMNNPAYPSFFRDILELIYSPNWAASNYVDGVPTRTVSYIPAPRVDGVETNFLTRQTLAVHPFPSLINDSDIPMSGLITRIIMGFPVMRITSQNPLSYVQRFLQGYTLLFPYRRYHIQLTSLALNANSRPITRPVLHDIEGLYRDKETLFFPVGAITSSVLSTKWEDVRLPAPTASQFSADYSIMQSLNMATSYLNLVNLDKYKIETETRADRRARALDYWSKDVFKINDIPFDRLSGESILIHLDNLRRIFPSTHILNQYIYSHLKALILDTEDLIEAYTGYFGFVKPGQAAITPMPDVYADTRIEHAFIAPDDIPASISYRELQEKWNLNSLFTLLQDTIRLDFPVSFRVVTYEDSTKYSFQVQKGIGPWQEKTSDAVKSFELAPTELAVLLRKPYLFDRTVTSRGPEVTFNASAITTRRVTCSNITHVSMLNAVKPKYVEKAIEPPMASVNLDPLRPAFIDGIAP